MKPTTILKGILGLALIYCVCLPILAIGKVVENKPIEVNQTKTVKFSSVERLRFLPPEKDNIGRNVFIDGYFNTKNGKLLEKNEGLLEY